MARVSTVLHDGDIGLPPSTILLGSTHFRQSFIRSLAFPPLPSYAVECVLMWLLSTSRAELREFVPHETAPPYAILSHVWGQEEQLFHDVQKIGRRARRQNRNPRDLVCLKIRRFCERAEAEGYEWAWTDTCCIDKTSSAELSEAINSMFAFYSRSAICYAYLEDVDPTGDGASHNAHAVFHQSRWHKRGWVLQELIASPNVHLLSSTWTFLGTKFSLADALQKITGIPASLLRRERLITDFSVAQRMSWASSRVTTRPEDEAYCLLGLFGIHMPTLYGEGRHAFRRLQEEIMRRGRDTTLFAWGEALRLDLGDPESGAMRRSDLFANTPRRFYTAAGIVYSPQPSIRDEDRIELSMTPRGVLAHIPVSTLDSGVTVANLSWYTSCPDPPRCLGPAECPYHNPVYLVLARDDINVPHHIPRYHVGAVLSPLHYQFHDGYSRILIGSSSSSSKICWTMSEIYLEDPTFTSNPTIARLGIGSIPFAFNRHRGVPYRGIHPRIIWRNHPDELQAELVEEKEDRDPRSSSTLVAMFQLSHYVYHPPKYPAIRVRIGTCTSESSSPSDATTYTSRRTHVYWARVATHSKRYPDTSASTHSCATDHLHLRCREKLIHTTTVNMFRIKMTFLPCIHPSGSPVLDEIEIIDRPLEELISHRLNHLPRVDEGFIAEPIGALDSCQLALSDSSVSGSPEASGSQPTISAATRILLNHTTAFPVNEAGPSMGDVSHLYIGSAIMDSGIHPCTIDPQICAARVSFAQIEIEHYGRYELLPFDPNTMEWVPAMRGKIPEGRRPIRGGFERNGMILYHARARRQGLLGKTSPSLGGAHIPFRGNWNHFIRSNYDLLCWRDEEEGLSGVNEAPDQTD